MKQKLVVEIKAAEGGEDAKLFVSDLAQAYQKMFGRLGWSNRLTSSRLGEIHIEVTGSDLSGLYNEPGGHRIQRIPPTERKGRVHTSTVTVAVIDPTIMQFTLHDSDLKTEWYSGTGAGGQHRNKHQNSCRLTHIPTNTVVTAQCRSRQNSYEQARQELHTRLQNQYNCTHSNNTATLRKTQVGSGMRGDKIRTIRFQDDTVVDHQTEKKMTASKYLKGYIDLLW